MTGDPMADLLARIGLEGSGRGRPGPEESAALVCRAFDAFVACARFATIGNFLKRKFFFETREAAIELLAGRGLNCQDQYFLLKEALAAAGLETRIIHGDVHDFTAGIIKEAFVSALVYRREDVLLHMDVLNKVRYRIRPASGGPRRPEADGAMVEDVNDGDLHYRIARPGEGGTMEAFRKDLGENYRIDRVRRRYQKIGITPFGIVPPFVWQAEPDRKIFYNVLADRIKLTRGRETLELDTLEWDAHPESDWLTREEKDQISQCLSEISLKIDLYRKIPLIESNFRPIGSPAGGKVREGG